MRIYIPQWDGGGYAAAVETVERTVVGCLLQMLVGRAGPKGQAGLSEADV